MGKTNFYLYGVRGKVGNIVARKGPNGGTVLAEHQPAVRNPRSNKQQAQRIILATVAAAAKFMNPIVNHSFEGVGIGAASKRRFRKLNMDRLRKLAAIDFEEAATGVDSRVFMTTKNNSALIPNSYIVSNGSLAPTIIKSKLSDPDTEGGRNFVLTYGSGNITAVTGTTEGVKYITLGDLMRVIFGIYSPGEQLTYIGIQKAGEGYQYAYNNEADNPGWMIPYTSMIARRLYVDLSVDFGKLIAITDAQGVPLNNLVATIASEIRLAFTNVRSDSALLNEIHSTMSELDLTYEAGVLAIDSIEEDYTAFNAADDDLGYLYAFGIIRSRMNENGSWSYSKTILALNMPTTDETTNFGLYWNSAVQAWFAGETVADDNEYLQAGSDQNRIGESFT